MAFDPAGGGHAGREATRLADDAPRGPGTNTLLIASITQDCVRDLYRIVNAEPQ
jgi:hypothetical protein